jgi:tetraacyldisaccharide 4'-kinase
MAHSSTRSAWRMLLLPCSWLYGMAVQLRNLLFNLDILHSESFDLPVISVGNITVGGTGKTPMIEYLTELLSPHFSVSILSRGYKRKTKGFRLVDTTSSTAEVGDEILQIKRKYPYVTAAVDEDRRKGIHSLLEKEANQPIEVILLDDAYQHRYVERDFQFC